MMTKLIKWANLFLIFLTLLSYLSPFVSPYIFWPLSFVGLLYPWLLLSNFIFIIYWGIQKDRYLLFSLITLGIGWGYLTSFIGLNNGNIDKNAQLKIVSYNVNNLKSLWNKKDTIRYKKAHAAFPFFKQKVEGVDIFCAQEASKYVYKYLSDSLNLSHILHFPKTKIKTCIFSKYAFINKGSMVFEKKTNSCVWGDLIFQSDTVRVYNVHLQSNSISPITEKLAKEGDIQSRETWRNIKQVIKRYKNAAQRRAKQAEQVAEHIHACPYPVILCGDLNDTPLSYPYHILSNGFQDSFKEKGQGIGTTYAGSIPALRIDYVFADQKFEILSHKVFKENFSDHYPVVGTLKIKEK
jgi:exonuclease III